MMNILNLFLNLTFQLITITLKITFQILAAIIQLPFMLFNGLFSVSSGFSAPNLQRFKKRGKSLGFGAQPEDQGNAHWATDKEIKDAHLYSPVGLILGKSLSNNQEFIRWNPEGHLITIAGTGSGKGISTVVPNLLTYPGPIVVTDPKGENYEITARARKDIGHKVYCLDPFNVCPNATKAQFNPLDLIDPSNPNFADEAKILADLLVLRTGEEKDPHWDDKARAILSGIIMFVAFFSPKGKRNLGEVRNIVMASSDKWETIIETMESATEADGLIARTAVMIERMADEERMSVFSAMEKHTEFLDSRPVVTSLAKSSFNIWDLKNGKISIYFVLPAAEIAMYSRLLRVWIGSCIRAMVKKPGKPTYPTLFMLDEAANLGKMDLISQGVTYLRGYGVTLWIILQNLSQLEELYNKGWETFLGNTVIQQYFGIQDIKTSEYVSNKAGKTTIRVLSTNEGRNTGASNNPIGFSISNSRGHSSALTVSETPRPLIMPDEVTRLSPNEAIIFMRGKPPIPVQKVPYFLDPFFAGMYDDNPYHQSM
jgi:type IV secretion system protein VirD4